MKKIVFPEPEDNTINIDSLVVDRPIIGYQYVNSKERGAIVFIEDKFIDRKKDKLVIFDSIDMLRMEKVSNLKTWMKRVRSLMEFHLFQSEKELMEWLFTE